MMISCFILIAMRLNHGTGLFSFFPLYCFHYILLSQLSRESDKRTDKRPMLSDLRESGSIEQDADIVMFLYRDMYYNKESEDANISECIIAKNRHGETGTVKLGWDGQFTRFSNLETQG